MDGPPGALHALALTTGLTGRNIWRGIDRARTVTRRNHADERYAPTNQDTPSTATMSCCSPGQRYRNAGFQPGAGRRRPELHEHRLSRRETCWRMRPCARASKRILGLADDPAVTSRARIVGGCIIVTEMTLSGEAGPASRQGGASPCMTAAAAKIPRSQRLISGSLTPDKAPPKRGFFFKWLAMKPDPISRLRRVRTGDHRRAGFRHQPGCQRQPDREGLISGATAAPIQGLALRRLRPPGQIVKGARGRASPSTASRCRAAPSAPASARSAKAVGLMGHLV